MNEIRILGIFLSDRIKESERLQELLTQNADIIKSRLGFHEVTEAICSRVGIIILQLKGSCERWDILETEISAIEGLSCQKMCFNR